jgi:hypothetical protein
MTKPKKKELLEFLDYHWEPLYGGHKEYKQIVQIIKLHYKETGKRRVK